MAARAQELGRDFQEVSHKAANQFLKDVVTQEEQLWGCVLTRQKTVAGLGIKTKDGGETHLRDAQVRYLVLAGNVHRAHARAWSGRERHQCCNKALLDKVWGRLNLIREYRLDHAKIKSTKGYISANLEPVLKGLYEQLEHLTTKVAEHEVRLEDLEGGMRVVQKEAVSLGDQLEEQRKRTDALERWQKQVLVQ
jgi:hypothetical protein